jgi:hypothetical protein
MNGDEFEGKAAESPKNESLRCLLLTVMLSAAKHLALRDVSMILRHLPKEFSVVPGRSWGWIEKISFQDAAGSTGPVSRELHGHRSKRD